jgi:alkyl hydroperoxide reductase subunit AhpC
VVLGLSVDSQFSHKAWLDTPRSKGGLGGLKYPLVSDLSKKISQDYGVLLEAGIALRGLFLIDTSGIIRHITINDLPIGRNVDDVIRTLDALQHVEQHGEVCPAGWQKGKQAIDPKNASSYFEKANK